MITFSEIVSQVKNLVEKDPKIDWGFYNIKGNSCFIFFSSPNSQGLSFNSKLKKLRTGSLIPKKTVTKDEELKLHSEMVKKYRSLVKGSVTADDYHPNDGWKIFHANNEELLNSTRGFWKELVHSINRQGYRVEVYMVECNMEEGGMTKEETSSSFKYNEFFMLLNYDEEFAETHKGKIGAKKLGLLEARRKSKLLSMNQPSHLSKGLYNIIDENFIDLFGQGNSMLERYSDEKSGKVLHEIIVMYDQYGEEPTLDDYTLTSEVSHWKSENLSIPAKSLEKKLNEFDPEVAGTNFYSMKTARLAVFVPCDKLIESPHWNHVVESVERYGYKIDIAIVEYDESPSRKNKISVFLFLQRDMELHQKHRGKIMARNLGLLDKRILSFEGFLFESNNDAVADILRTLARNYESKKFFYTDHLQFNVEEERREWRDTRKYVQLEETVKHDAEYLLKFKLDGAKYSMEIKFDFTFKGAKEKDAPENLADSDIGRLGVVLTGIQPKSLKLKSNTMDFSTSSLAESLKDATVAFLQKMMSVDYDTLGPELYDMQQK